MTQETIVLLYKNQVETIKNTHLLCKKIEEEERLKHKLREEFINCLLWI